MAAPMKHACRKYLLHFAHEHLEFRIPEIQAIFSLLNLKLNFGDNYDRHSPFLVVDLPSEKCAQQITDRAVLVKSVYELWGQGRNYEELHKSITQFPADRKAPFSGPADSFRATHESFNKLLTAEEKLRKIETVLDPKILPFEGPVDLKNPAHSYFILEYYGKQNTDSPSDPYMVYFGRWLADGQREFIRKYDLQTRNFIGNTSMDAGLSLIMANMGQCKAKDLIFDPFVGTGSLLVACAHFGAYVMGTDVNYKIIHGQDKKCLTKCDPYCGCFLRLKNFCRASRRGQKWRGPDENIRANLRQYDLQQFYIDAMVADASKHSMWNPKTRFDAIITDPPYGIREQTRKLGSKKDGEVSSIPADLKEGHIPCKTSYQLSDMLKDLLNFAARHLMLHGRLVYWLPVYRPDYVDENVPRHPCLHLVANSEQPLNQRIGRRLITMEKVCEWEDDGIMNGAAVVEDHYGDSSFREKYFRATDKETDPSHKCKVDPEVQNMDTDTSGAKR